ncbi:MAG: hypothetical protein VX589_09425 [Myxococcota bacterium]|nr:hypothetical protein [Myxococcota bacterium]
MILLFPTEAMEYREVRARALTRFRDGCRRPVIRQFGLETEDLGFFVTHCQSCDSTTAKLLTVTDLDLNMEIGELEAELRNRVTDPKFGWVPKTFPACNAEHPRPISAVFAHYMPEIERDFQIHFVRNGARIQAVEHYLMDASGRAEKIECPPDQLACVDVLGAPLDVRAFWRRFIELNLYSDDVVVQEIQAGYYAGLRPYADSDARIAGMAEPFHRWIEEKQAEANYDIIAYFKDREDDDIPVPYRESYHVWLGGFATEVAHAYIEPFMFVSSDAFVAALDKHARMYGLRVERRPNDEQLLVAISGGDVCVEINMAPTLFRLLHEGLTFERGIHKHFCHELRALTATAETVELLRHALPHHDIELINGHILSVVRPDGTPLGQADAVRVATAYNVRDEAEFEGLVAALDPEATPEAVTLGPPCAGRLSRVIRRRAQATLPADRTDHLHALLADP